MVIADELLSTCRLLVPLPVDSPLAIHDVLRTDPKEPVAAERVRSTSHSEIDCSI